MSAGGYHHHLGLNVWGSKNGPLPPKNTAGLEQFVIELPNDADVAALRARIEVALDVRDRKQLEQILAGIKRIPGVFDIERVYNI